MKVVAIGNMLLGSVMLGILASRKAIGSMSTG